MNWAQQILFDNLWYLNIILKARQLGITTFFCLLYLDDVIFNGYDAGLIAHTREAAEKIFDTKIRYAWDNLPESIKREYQVNADSARELQFKLGNTTSSIYVGTSLRSGTVQRLHWSEASTVDQKYPAKAEEIRTGALNTVHKGQIVSIESTAKGDYGIFAEFCKTAMDLAKTKRTLTEMDYKFFFFPWYKDPEYKLEAPLIIPTALKDYFSSIERQEGIVLSEAQKKWYFKKSVNQKEAMKSEYPSTPEEAFTASIEGAYYGKQMDRIMEQGRIMSVPWIPELPVDTWWDLGIAAKKKDAMSIIFTQDVGLEIHIIDFYGNSGEGLQHYIKYLNEKPYVYGSHWAPHDIEMKELGTGKTRLEMAQRMGLNFNTLPRIGFIDGIDAVRVTLDRCWFDEEKTQELFKALKAYRKEWDDVLGRFKDRPLEDWSCDASDAMRMLAVGHRENVLLDPFRDYVDEDPRFRKRLPEEKIKVNPLNPFGDI